MRLIVMSHHIVTVCVVCVLCAAHIPCSAHTDVSVVHTMMDNSTGSRSPSNLDTQGQLLWTLERRKAETAYSNKRDRSNNISSSNKRNAVRYNDTQLVISDNHNDSDLRANVDAIVSDNDTYVRKKIAKNFKGGGRTRDTRMQQQSWTTENDSRDTELLKRLAQTELNYKFQRFNEDSRAINSSRLKRDVAVDERYFMKKIFEAYGDGKSITMGGFETLVRKLGLLRLLNDESILEDDGVDRSIRKNQLDSDKDFRNKGLQDADKSGKERCLNIQELLRIVAQDSTISDNITILPGWLFERVCPALVHQLAAESSSERNGCIRVFQNYKSDNHEQVTVDKFYTTEDSTRNTMQVWLYSTISIVIISLSGLLGVAVIPIMGKTYYNHVLQFLVALAVGTLTGDAFIHLLPHAMMSPHHHEHDEHHEHEDEHHHRSNSLLIDYEAQHNVNMWKGLVAMMGFVLFFFTEKALTMLAEWRKHRQRRNKLPTRVRVMRESDGPNSNVVGEKLCKHKYSSYPYCYGEIANETQDNHHNRQINHHERPPIIEEEKPLTSNCNSATKIVTSDTEKKPKEDWRLDDSIVNNSKKNADGADVSLNESESYTVIIREHETKHHGHSHSHGHVHSAPESMSSVAWMVVMGDGLHNFTDGMAIGAAFSANIAGGFSTAIAVFCHELPHELGDFAVLLKAGMSAKQAVFYNLLSSVLCFFGMIAGVLLGSAPAATSWVFAAAAGIFIYIALVDMIPELSSSHSAEHGSRWQSILQGLGLITGLGIMLLIALYEHDLKHIFSE
ncbi:PREDICTED: zinc transporter ZIP14-like isoform X2 [Dinoponera quadriceps]|uniref:Zinc transporter ZIP14-like isoform X2 n=1 Tax=Dinoponera quadriceps TaxID=609295 RepID=A0A6P3XPJ2_DINQU|nr:PREDICTED: zinc transporter ZIP14-like isoform X2 [Dinoponera quadriceps]XP_014480321.1 PREDICTED: zinc transporter ZIP14-like isoform X2 [Dinoponera quadriceps]